MILWKVKMSKKFLFLILGKHKVKAHPPNDCPRMQSTSAMSDLKKMAELHLIAKLLTVKTMPLHGT